MNNEMPKECIFCGKPRIKRGEIQWQSGISIVTDFIIKDRLVTVCPDCRKKQPIQDLYTKVIELLMEDAKEILALEDVEEEVEKKPRRSPRSPLW